MRFFPVSLQSAVRPRRACEIASDGIFAARSAGVEAPMDATAYVPLRNGVTAGLTAPVLQDRATVLAGLKEALDAIDPDARDWTIVLPDACMRVSILDFDTLPQKPQEILPLVRFRLRRMVPFDADTAAVSYQSLKSGNSTDTNGPVQIIAAAMPAEVRDEFESLVRETGREPGVLLPATLAALAAMPDTGSQLLVHTGQGLVTTGITRNGQLLLYRGTEYSDAQPAETAQAVLVAAAYYEDALHTQLEEVWVAGLEAPEALRTHLEVDGEWRIPLRSPVTSEVFSASAAPAHVPASRYTSVMGALRG